MRYKTGKRTRHFLKRTGADDGGLPARRAIIRWAWRLFRREWRQQTLALALLTVAVAAAIALASAAYTLAPLGNSPDKFGTANQVFVHDSADPQLLEDNIAALEGWYGAVDMIGRRYVPVPGTAELVELRAQDPQGTYSGPMLALQDGRYPTSAGEVAVTEAVAESFDLTLHTRFSLDGSDWTVVGLVENPSDLRDEFILVPPAYADPPSTVTILVRGSDEQFLSFPWPDEGLVSHEMHGSTVENVEVLAAGAALGIAAVAMILVALVAAAVFIVVAQRRQRQMGMLAAIGAADGHLRLVMLANGAIVGGVAAVVGAALGLLGWIAAVPFLETTLVGARINRFDVLPWWLIGLGMLLAVLAATGAAWWPARAVSRLPVVAALSGRPSQPQPVRPAAARAGLIVAGGLTCLAIADAAAIGWIEMGLIGVGTSATALGMLLFSPVAIWTLATAVGRLPVGVRLALRDLARYRTRSAVMLAAISLALGMATAVIISVTRTEHEADLGNLSDSQLSITVEGSRIRELVTTRSPAELEQLRAQIYRLAASLEDPLVIELQMAVDPDETPNPGRRGNTWRHAVWIGEGEHTANPGPLFVATPELLRYYGIDPATVDPNTDALTIREGEIGFRRGIEEELVTGVERLDMPAYASAPTSLITLDALARRGWEAATVGWFVVAARPITGEQLAAAREVAANASLMVENRDGVNLATLRSVRTGAMIAGTVVAISILALAVGLIRSETAGDLRILTATGATASVRRMLTAATAGGLAVLGVVLGITGAYLGLAASSITELDTLTGVPVGHLVIVALGVPLLAAAVGWLLSGRQPSALARRPIE
jgi:putative ABC transport system permease protein